MKKIFKILIGIALVLLLSGSVSATEWDVVGDVSAGGKITDAKDKTGEVVVSYNIQTESYKLSIPISFSFTDQDVPFEANVVATEVTLAKNRVLTVNVSSTHNWQMIDHSVLHGNSIDYKMVFKHNNEGDDKIAINTDPAYHGDVTVMTLSGKTELTVPLVFTMLDMPSTLGNYADTLTFKASVDDIS